MTREPNTRRDGGHFWPDYVGEVWLKAKLIQGEDPTYVRQDPFGIRIEWEKYGQEEDFGWEIDHICPVSQNGGDELLNLQPLFWETNRVKGEHYPWECINNSDFISKDLTA